MKSSTRLFDERANQVLHLLNSRFRITTEDVSKVLHIAPSTTRKLLAAMEKKGLLIRTHGGAVSVDANKDISLAQKSLVNVNRKKMIALCARSYVEDGDRIAVAGGSTLLEFCSSLLNLKHSTVVTDSITSANILVRNHDIEVQICAGIVSERTGCIVGTNAMQTFNSASFDKAFIGVDGIDLEHGFWGDNILISNVERCMARAARQVFVLADSSKMGRTSVQAFMNLGEADIIITNPFEDRKFISQLQRRGCQVVFSKEPEEN